MSYTVLARKYRPQTFADLVGQEHVTRTLANAITSGRVAHAFLFTGVRGVGKTTSARILAKALNCERGPTPEPCNECDICKQITSGVDLDVLEIDGASNNGVDDVRRLQESLPYRPARDRFKIVIVDEVHMLSGGAFNAFLKTLEEPPAHVKFIFATTESHKVPVTIRSRCQRYDFRLIPQQVIADRVRDLLGREQIAADDEAVAIIAREAAGSMRDAVTLLDQVIAFSGENLVGRDVAEKLGIADRAQLFELADSVIVGDAKRALTAIDAMASRGLDLSHLTRQWLELLRDMVVLAVASDRAELVELPEAEREKAISIARNNPLLELQRVFAGVAKLIDEVAKSSSPRLLLEMGALRLATRPPLQDLAELIAKLGQLESGGTGGATPSRAAPPRPPPSDPRARSAQPEATSVRPMPERPAPPREARSDPAKSSANPFQRFIPPESSSGNEPSMSAAAPLPTAPANTQQAGSVSPGPSHSSASSVAAASARELAPLPAPVAAAKPAVPAVRPVVAPVTPLPTPARNEVTAPLDASAAPPPRPADVALEASSGAALYADVAKPAAREVPGPSTDWMAIVQALRKLEPRWSAMYEHGAPLELSPARLVVLFQEGSFFGRQAQTPAGIDALRRAVELALGTAPQIEVRSAFELPGQTVAQHDAARVDERKESIRKKALSHPRVVEALKVFPELGQKQEVQID